MGWYVDLECLFKSMFLVRHCLKSSMWWLWTLQLLCWSSAKYPAIFCTSLVPTATSLLDQWSWCEWCSFPWCWWQQCVPISKIFMIFMKKSSNQWRSTMKEPVPQGVAASTMSLQKSIQAIAKLQAAAILSNQKYSLWWTKSSVHILRVPVDLCKMAFIEIPSCWFMQEGCCNATKCLRETSHLRNHVYVLFWMIDIFTMQFLSFVIYLVVVLFLGDGPRHGLSTELRGKS